MKTYDLYKHKLMQIKNLKRFGSSKKYVYDHLSLKLLKIITVNKPSPWLNHDNNNIDPLGIAVKFAKSMLKKVTNELKLLASSVSLKTRF